MTWPRLILSIAIVVAVSLGGPDGLRAQAPTDSDSEADSASALIARADSARAALVQPQGSRGPSIAHFVRLPFHLFGAGIALAAGIVYLPYQLVQETGILTSVGNLDRELDGLGVHIDPGFIGSRSGPALVVRWDGSAPLFGEAGISTRGYTLLRGGLAFGDDTTGIELAAARRDLNQLHFWGVGPSSSSIDRSDYALLRREVTLEGWTPLTPHLRLGLGGGWEENVVGRGEDDRRPDLHTVFDALPGASGTTSFARAQAQLDLDFSRVDEEYQLAGARLLADWVMYRGVDGTDADFQIGTADARLFQPIDRRHAIALRGLASETWGESGSGIPFYHMTALGESNGLRGYRSWRFRDRALAAATAEWRYQVWYHPGDPAFRLDGVAFVDHGTVAPSLRDIAWKDFQTTPGMGLRLMKAGRGMVEGYVAFEGEESPRWGFELGSSF